MTRQTRLDAAARRDEILRAGLQLAVSKGYDRVTRDDIAAVVGIVPTAVQYHYSTMAKLRRDLMRHAVQSRCLAVIAQGLAARDPRAQAAPDALKRQALEALVFPVTL